MNNGTPHTVASNSSSSHHHHHLGDEDARKSAVKISLYSANQDIDEHAEVTVALKNPEQAVEKMLRTLAQRFPPESVMTIQPASLSASSTAHSSSARSSSRVSTGESNKQENNDGVQPRRDGRDHQKTPPQSTQETRPPRRTQQPDPSAKKRVAPSGVPKQDTTHHRKTGGHYRRTRGPAGGDSREWPAHSYSGQDMMNYMPPPMYDPRYPPPPYMYGRGAGPFPPPPMPYSPYYYPPNIGRVEERPRGSLEAPHDNHSGEDYMISPRHHQSSMGHEMANAAYMEDRGSGAFPRRRASGNVPPKGPAMESATYRRSSVAGQDTHAEATSHNGVAYQRVESRRNPQYPSRPEGTTQWTNQNGAEQHHHYATHDDTRVPSARNEGGNYSSPRDPVRYADPNNMIQYGTRGRRDSYGGEPTGRFGDGTDRNGDARPPSSFSGASGGIVIPTANGRELELKPGFGTHVETLSNGDTVRYVEVDVIQEKVVEVPVPEVREVERVVKVPEIRTIEKIQEVPEVEWQDKEVPIIKEEVVVKEVPVKQVVDVPTTVVKEVEVIIPRVEEKVVEIPEIIHVDKPYNVETRVNVPVYYNKEVPTVVAQKLCPVLRETTEKSIKVNTKTYEPVLYAVNVYIPKPVSSAIVASGKVEESHNIVQVPPAQYNSLITTMNTHLENDALQQMFVRTAQGHAPLLPAGQTAQYVPPKPGALPEFERRKEEEYHQMSRDIRGYSDADRHRKSHTRHRHRDRSSHQKHRHGRRH